MSARMSDPLPRPLAQLPDAARPAHAGKQRDPSEARPTRITGWRLRLLAAWIVLGAIGVLLVARSLSDLPTLDATWRINTHARIELVQSDQPTLSLHAADTLEEIIGIDGTTVEADPLLMQRSSRWIVSDADRARHEALHRSFAQILLGGSAKLRFADGSVVDVPLPARGAGSLGVLFWALSGIGLLLWGVAGSVVIARPRAANFAYALMGICQSGNLLFMATQSALELRLPPSLTTWDLMARVGFDLVTAAAMVSAACLHPHRLPYARRIQVGVWFATALVLAAVLGDAQLPIWWITQGWTIVLSIVTMVLLTWSYRIEPNPFAAAMRRFCFVAALTWTLLSFSVAAAQTVPGLPQSIANSGSAIWYVFFASALLLIPFLSRSRSLIREFTLVAAVATVATSIDLLLISLMSIGPFTSLTLSLFSALCGYALARRWMLQHVAGGRALSTESLFERLYRLAREVESRPDRAGIAMQRLLRDLFEPLESEIVDQRTAASWITSDGSTLTVPVPSIDPTQPAATGQSVQLRYARRGHRLFTSDDVRLSDRLSAQLRSLVTFDLAVQQGRDEERSRLAQDLHDDIGARLLTLMYQAQTPEMEEYARRTLQDLKTLTRGLAARGHRLSDVAADWKGDLSMRLEAAQCTLAWTLEFDEDIELGVVQWSALTRVLRELVSNVISHSHARHVEVVLQFRSGGLELVVRDDGIGREPAGWSHGLGLGGIRKRVKQLGGTVRWGEREPGGIECHVRIPELARSN